MRTMLRIVFLIGCIALLIWAALAERHTVHSFGQPQPQRIDGMQFVERATYDGLTLVRGELFDIHSLSPGTAQEKDCKT